MIFEKQVIKLLEGKLNLQKRTMLGEKNDIR